MNVRALACSLTLGAMTSCGGIVADDADATPNVPVDDAGVAAYVRCDDKLSASWRVSCSGAPVDHGQICATPRTLEECGTLADGCSGATIDAILTYCDPGFFSRPGAKFGVDVDDSGCVTSIEWAQVGSDPLQCAVNRLTGMRFPCFGATAITASCAPPTH